MTSRSRESTGAGSKVTTSSSSIVYPPGARGSSRTVTAPLEHTAHPSVSPSSSTIGIVATTLRPVAMTTW